MHCDTRQLLVPTRTALQIQSPSVPVDLGGTLRRQHIFLLITQPYSVVCTALAIAVDCTVSNEVGNA